MLPSHFRNPNELNAGIARQAPGFQGLLRSGGGALGVCQKEGALPAEPEVVHTPVLASGSLLSQPAELNPFATPAYGPVDAGTFSLCRSAIPGVQTSAYDSEMAVFGKVLLSLLILGAALTGLYMSAYAFSALPQWLAIGRTALLLFAGVLLGMVWHLPLPWLAPLTVLVAGLAFLLFKQGGGL